MRKLLWGKGQVPGRFGWLRWLALVIVCTGTAHAGGLNDTGITDCYSDTAVDNATSVEADTGTHPRQDCRYGRDPAAAAGVPKTGAGGKGFDFQKIANDGTVLDATAALGLGAKDWACTRDNVTGLIWEIKTTSGLRSQSYTYTWYNSDVIANGGSAGTASGGSCSGGTGCDTEKFVADVNTAKLCGATNWRMPSKSELMSIVDYGRYYYPLIDPTYFPNTLPSDFWSATAFAGSSGHAWYVDFNDGHAYFDTKSALLAARLVHTGP